MWQTHVQYSKIQKAFVDGGDRGQDEKSRSPATMSEVCSSHLSEASSRWGPSDHQAIGFC